MRSLRRRSAVRSTRRFRTTNRSRRLLYAVAAAAAHSAAKQDTAWTDWLWVGMLMLSEAILESLWLAPSSSRLKLEVDELLLLAGEAALPKAADIRFPTASADGSGPTSLDGPPLTTPEAWVCFCVSECVLLLLLLGPGSLPTRIACIGLVCCCSPLQALRFCLVYFALDSVVLVAAVVVVAAVPTRQEPLCSSPASGLQSATHP